MMPEAEVTLRFAFWLLGKCGANAHADVAIDGAHVKIAGHHAAGIWIEQKHIFPIESFLQELQWLPKHGGRGWRGAYSRSNQTLAIRSAPGFDVQVVWSGKCIKAECKGGPLGSIKGKSATSILAQAIGQVIACGESGDSELWVAVPDSESFETVAVRLSKIDAFRRTGIKIALVSKTGDVRVVS